MIPVILESPFSGDFAANRQYLNQCISDCLAHNETPYASHKMLTDSLNDLEPEQRKLGISAGFVWHKFAKRSVVYLDKGEPSWGMLRGICSALLLRKRVHFRALKTNRTAVLWRPFWGVLICRHYDGGRLARLFITHEWRCTAEIANGSQWVRSAGGDR